MSPFELSSCCSCMLLAIFSPSSYSGNKWNVCHFSSSQPKQLNLIPRSSRLTVHQPAKTLHFLCHSLAKHKILPNLVISNWLWRITGKRVLLARIRIWEIFEWIIWLLTVKMLLHNYYFYWHIPHGDAVRHELLWKSEGTWMESGHTGRLTEVS